jgi:hypothetical protein
MLFDAPLDPSRLAHVFAQAASPAFFLGAVTGLVSILTSRLGAVMGDLKEEKADRIAHAALRRRARYLHSAINLALASGLATALLLALSFIGAFFQFEHIYGAALLFLLATGLVGAALVRFYREIRVSLAEVDRLAPPGEG